MNNKETFSLAEILSVTSGVLLLENFDDLFRIFCFMTQDDDLFTHQFLRVKEEITPYLYEQLPFLKDANKKVVTGKEWKSALDALVKEYGEFHELFPMHHEDHRKTETLQDIHDELKEMGFKDNQIFDFKIDDEEPDEPSPYGNIDWK